MATDRCTAASLLPSANFKTPIRSGMSHACCQRPEFAVASCQTAEHFYQHTAASTNFFNRNPGAYTSGPCNYRRQAQFVAARREGLPAHGDTGHNDRLDRAFSV